jgi:hypothetical protein
MADYTKVAHRRAKKTLRLVDAQGAPLKNVTLKFSQTNHQFLFGWGSFDFNNHFMTTDPEKKDFIIFYFSFLRPLYRDLYFDDETEYEVDVIDTWNMEIQPQGVFKGRFRIVVGGKPYMALRVRAVK